MKKQKRLKDGRTCIIEVPREQDANELLAYMKQVAGESDNLTFGPQEFSMTIEEEKLFIRRQRSQENALFLVARIDGKIVGNLNLQGGVRERLRHSASFGISILQEYWGLGIGKLLLEEMIAHAKKVGLSKVNLKVRTDNQRAIRLYKQMGFEEEGRERQGFVIEGEYIDLYLMGLVLEPNTA